MHYIMKYLSMKQFFAPPTKSMKYHVEWLSFQMYYHVEWNLSSVFHYYGKEGILETPTWAIGRDLLCRLFHYFGGRDSTVGRDSKERIQGRDWKKWEALRAINIFYFIAQYPILLKNNSFLS